VMFDTVVVKDVLDTHRLSTIRRGAEMAIREMVGRDEMRVGNRGSHRYSFGSAPASFGFQDYWSVLIDPPVLMEVMEAIFGTKDFVTNTGSGGGDYNVPGSVEYQNLHSDSGGLPNSQYHDTKLEYLPEGQVFGPWPDGNRRRVDVDAPEDPANTYETVNGRDVPAREHSVTVNYPFEVRADSTVGHTAYNGATRQIPGTASLDVRNGNPLPSLEEEPTWMKMSTTQPCPAGSAMIRDDRAWHGCVRDVNQQLAAPPSCPSLTLLAPGLISLARSLWYNVSHLISSRACVQRNSEPRRVRTRDPTPRQLHATDASECAHRGAAASLAPLRDL
jgi:hypothetical protein